MNRLLLRTICLIAMFFVETGVYSADGSIGDLANDLMEPVSILSDFIGTGSLIIGITCLFGAFLRYMQYRVNPLMSPMSTVIVLLILGLLLVCVPFLYKVLGYGLPFPSSD